MRSPKNKQGEENPVSTLILSSGLIRVQAGVDQKELLLLQAAHRQQVPLVGAPRAISRLLANKQP